MRLRSPGPRGAGARVLPDGHPVALAASRAPGRWGVSIFCAMDDFVNYKKRSVSLPLGCKDLLDVLRRRPERRSQEFADLLRALGGNPEAARKILTSEKFTEEEINDEIKWLLTELEKE